MEPPPGITGVGVIGVGGVGGGGGGPPGGPGVTPGTPGGGPTDGAGGGGAEGGPEGGPAGGDPPPAPTVRLVGGNEGKKAWTVLTANPKVSNTATEHQRQWGGRREVMVIFSLRNRAVGIEKERGKRQSI